MKQRKNSVLKLLWAILPNLALTPGAADPSATVKRICVPGYTSQPGVRHVTDATKREVFRRYAVKFEPGKYEVDHLISLELGGSNDISNLWPEAYEPRPGAHEKDLVENDLHRKVCAGKITLPVAQDLIAHRWLTYYREMMGARHAK